MVFSDTAEDIRKQQEQTPEQMLEFVTEHLVPYFNKRAELEAMMGPEELN